MQHFIILLQFNYCHHFEIVHFQLLLSTLIKIFDLSQENWTKDEITRIRTIKENLRDICQIEESNFQQCLAEKYYLSALVAAQLR